MTVDDTTAKHIIVLADDFCARLMELGCDSVQIVATARAKNDEWAVMVRGKGNVYARMGAVRDWLDGRTGETLASEIATALGDAE